MPDEGAPGTRPTFSFSGVRADSVAGAADAAAAGGSAVAAAGGGAAGPAPPAGAPGVQASVSPSATIHPPRVPILAICGLLARLPGRCLHSTWILGSK